MKTRCPKCKKEINWEENEWRPFCSERCKMVDLGAWVSEDYKIPEVPGEYDEEVPGGEGQDEL